MARSLYLINPRSEGPSYFGGESYSFWGFPAAQSIADLATATVAAFAPRDWQVEICEEYVEPVDFDHPADYVGITGKITQWSRMRQVAAEFRQRGRKVIIGGPFASLSPDVVRGHCDVLVIGELEGIAEELFADLERGTFREEYVAEDKPELDRSPLPRWDLYPNHRAAMGCVQTSRGCPFECEFCDVIQYLGRKQRHKTTRQILTELDQLYEIGYRSVFLADDNFTVYRKRAKEVLVAVRDWNRAHAEDPMTFTTQVSIDAARDAEILRLCSEAGMTWVFIGIETPNEESLKETKKRQNLGVDLGGQIQRFLDHGIQVTGGMIVGFDHDGPDIFERQYRFAMSTPVPMFSLGALVAPAATPLYDRIKASGRLVEGGSEQAASIMDTNIMPTSMSRQELLEGLRWLCNRLYRPDAFAQRTVQMIDALGPWLGPQGDREAIAERGPREIEVQGLAMLKRLIRRGPEERRMWATIWEAAGKKPGAEGMALQALAHYAQGRCLYEFGNYWEPQVAESWGAQPPAAESDDLIQLGR